MIFITQEEEIKIDDWQVIYFYSSWMPFHKKVMFMLDRIENKYPILSILAIDVDLFKNQCKRFKIDVVPTILILKDGKEYSRTIGITSTKVFDGIFDDICIS